jgi:hypothetical protein
MSAIGAGVPWCRGVTPARRNPRAMTSPNKIECKSDHVSVVQAPGPE